MEKERKRGLRRGDEVAAADTHAIEVRAVSVAFGGVRALTDVSASVSAREIVAVIGPNGAGKTTLLNAICGLVRKSGGEVAHYGVDVTNTHPTRIVQGGLGRSFQDPRLIDSMTVIENVLCGTHATIGYSLFDQVARRRKVGRDASARRGPRRASCSTCLAWVSSPRSTPSNWPTARARWSTSCARRWPVRACCCSTSHPRASMWPSAPACERMLLMIHREFHIPMLIVEHHMDLVRAVSGRILALVSGSVAIEGPTDRVLDSEEFRATMTGDISMSGRKPDRKSERRVATPDA